MPTNNHSIPDTINEQPQQTQRHETSDNRREDPSPVQVDPEPRLATSLENSLWAGLDPEQRRLRTLVLDYYTQYLSKLVSCDHVDQDEVPGMAGVDSSKSNDRRAAGFDAFRNLAAVSAGSARAINGAAFPTSILPQADVPTGSSSTWGPAQILHTALLAWASRHWLNKGEVRYEAASEVWGKRAETMLARYFEESGDDLLRNRSTSDSEQTPSRPVESVVAGDRSPGGDVRDSGRGAVGGKSGITVQDRRERKMSDVTTLAACLMTVQWKVSPLRYSAGRS
jgi:hypothetical protein